MLLTTRNSSFRQQAPQLTVYNLVFRSTTPRPILFQPKGGVGFRDGWVHTREPYRERPSMTITFKLSRRLVRFRALPLMAALLVTVSCVSEDLNEPSTPATTSDPTAVEIFPEFATVAVSGSTTFRAEPTILAGSISDARSKRWPRTRLHGVTVPPGSQTLAPGAKQPFKVTAATSAGTVTLTKLDWTATGGQIDTAGSYTAGNRPGKYLVIVRTPFGLADTASVTIVDTTPTPTPTPAPPPVSVARVILTPATATVAAGASVSFSAEGKASSGSTVAITTEYRATGGSITTAGKYTAPSSAGTYEVIAADPTSGNADTATVTVTVDAPVVSVVSQVVLTPASASIAAGGTKQFSATGQLATGAAASITPRYGSTGGTISGAGMYTAGKSSGTFRVIATDTVSGKADTASVTVTPVVGSISVTPVTASVAAGATKQLSVSVLDAAGAALSGQTITWSSASTATATVSSLGVVTGITAGTVTITATTGGQNDKATITVTEPSPTPTLPSTPPPSADVAGCPNSGYKRIVNVSAQSQLLSAISGAQPGDQIRLANGIYRGSFQVRANGSSSDPITVCGSRSAVVDNAGGYILVAADNWTFQGFRVTNGLFGIRVEGGTGNVFQGLEVSNIGQEGIHLLKFSTDNVIRGNWIHDTGESTPQYGEGVYLGTDQTRWSIETSGQPDRSDRNEVLDNTIGPNVRGEAVDIKEGTTGGIIRGNTFNGSGQNFISGFTESWVTVKGNDYALENNTGTQAPKNGFWGFVKVAGWGNGNAYRANTMEIDGSGYGIRTDGGSGNVVACDNVATSAGGLSNVKCQ